MHFFHDSGVSPVLESSCIPYTLRFCARGFLALTKKLLSWSYPVVTARWQPPLPQRWLQRQMITIIMKGKIKESGAEP